VNHPFESPIRVRLGLRKPGDVDIDDLTLSAHRCANGPKDPSSKTDAVACSALFPLGALRVQHLRMAIVPVARLGPLWKGSDPDTFHVLLVMDTAQSQATDVRA
jgi:hypothetical protein